MHWVMKNISFSLLIYLSKDECAMSLVIGNDNGNDDNDIVQIISFK